MDKGSAGRTGRNVSGSDQRGQRQKRGMVRGGRSDRQVRPLSFYFYSPPRSSSFRMTLFLQSTSTSGVGWDVSDTGGITYLSDPPQEVGGVTGTSHVIFLFSTLFVSSPHSSSFPLSTVQQQTGLGRTQRGQRGRR